jgi:hypothetical protein
MVSVLEDLSGDPPDYMTARNHDEAPPGVLTPQDFNGWHSGRELQQRLHRLAFPAR